MWVTHTHTHTRTQAKCKVQDAQNARCSALIVTRPAAAADKKQQQFKTQKGSRGWGAKQMKSWCTC